MKPSLLDQTSLQLQGDIRQLIENSRAGLENRGEET
jgi:hypothetical protein